MSKDAALPTTGIVHQHNLPADRPASEFRFGLRMRLPAGDTFAAILGESWEKTRWFQTEADREKAMRELRRQHPYYRSGDRPTLSLEKINKSLVGS